jgi:tetratricopeptide (TPR) repeat protein
LAIDSASFALHNPLIPTMPSSATIPVPVARKPSACESMTRSSWLSGGVLLLLTFLVYIPSYNAGFIWDDDVIAGAPLMREGWTGLRDIWFSTRYGDFCPLTATSFWIEWQFYGALKEIQHVTNIVLQALNGLLLWRALLSLRIPGAWLIAAVFAVHPVGVASVTWLAERKNTLSMFFYLLSLLFFLRSETRVEPTSAIRFHKGRYWLSFVFFLFGLLSKSAVVVLPVVLLLCLWWRDGSVSRQNFRKVFPFFAFSFAVGLGTLVAHHYIGPKLGVLPTEDDGFTRLLTASRAFWFYVWKDIFPIGLTMHYPRWKIDPASIMAYLPAIGTISALFLFWRFRASWGRACLFGIGYFVLAVSPTIGIVNMAFLMVAPVADHLQYLALPGIVALVIGGGTYFLTRTGRSPRLAVISVGVLIIVPFSVLSWQHQRIMAKPEALWRDNLRKNPVSWISHNNLGGISFERGQYTDALHSYEAALQGRNNLSMVHVNVGRALFALDRTEEAVTRYKDALRLDPTDFKAHNNLGVAYISLGKTNEAIACFQKAVELVPGDATFFANLTGLLLESGRNAQAIQLVRERLKQAPGNAAAHYSFAGMLFKSGRIEEAHAHYAKAVELAPEFIEARFGLAEILARLNKKSEAIQHWREIVRRKPDAVQVLANLAWALATDPNDALRNGREAVVLAEKTCALAGKENPAYLDLLAAAYAEAGRFQDAVEVAGRAVLLAENNQQSAEPYRARMTLYAQQRPYRTP